MNAIRRTLIADVPKLAIEDVEFHLGPIRDEATGKDYDSSTSMFDEAIPSASGCCRSRPTSPSSVGSPTARAAGPGCPQCQVMFSIDQKGPCTVYAQDVVPLGDDTLAILEPENPDRAPRGPTGAPGLRDRDRGHGAGARQMAGRARRRESPLTPR